MIAENGDDTSMNFLDHLKELRQKLIYSIIFFIFSFIISFYFSQSIFEFLAKPLTSILQDGNGLIYTALQEAFLTNVKVAFFTAAFISFPFLSFQIWSFISPGLLKKEKKISLPSLIAIPFLFLLGAAVVYYLISPIAWKFFLSFQTSQADSINITLQAKMNEYLSLMMTFIFAFGLAFQLPVVLLLLVRVGVLTIQQLVSFRKYAIVLAFIFAAIITPPDPFSQISLALPVIILYEVSILISRFLSKKDKKKDKSEDE
ncbi:MAG: twin-arginine translocase subunit TatC [Alphaproteobacteria bacterium]|jgi:sec-independent protein translocase protein TatC|nr:twin-arginine translocase subunit TatC [Alphaproteobacteria bacterium]|tara:strand:+ start:284 stop:1060 length:777 start_codon:yes stop_codon:yes gene_type:complete